MKCKRNVILMLGMFFYMPIVVYGGVVDDSLMMEKIFTYRRNYSAAPAGESRNVYMKFWFNTKRRNPTLLLVPTLYNIARGKREFVGETYGRMSFKNIKDYDIKRQVEVSTIPHHSRTMPMMIKYIVPDFYGVSLFQEFLLSPFNRNNRKFYRYHISGISTKRHLITFWPKLRNTQLVTGFAIVDSKTGRLISVKLRGEHDMIHFNMNADMGDSETSNSVIPRCCVTDATFNFVGNRLTTQFTAYFDMDKTLPDSIDRLRDKDMMSELRPTALTETESRIYEEHFKRETSEDSVRSEVREDSVAAKKSNVFEKAWDLVGDHIFNSTRAETSNAYFRLSPILNPLYFGYSGSRGISYKMRIGAEYRFSHNRTVSLNPSLGYNFKIKQLYFDIPLRYTFNKRRKGWVQLTIANGNRITNSAVLDMLDKQYRDTVDFRALQLDYFKDTHAEIAANISPVDELEMTFGLTYYRRSAVNKAALIANGQRTIYRSFVPSLSLTYQPTKAWPVLSLIYDRSFRNIFNSDTEFEKIELDASYKKNLSSLRKLNLRAGIGFYTDKSGDYFVDFANFHENYLPGGWDDDWTGEFQLLNSEWYNASQYYVRANVSYDSPLLLLSRVPMIGKYLETERLYGGFAQIEHTRPYFELGYGFTTRYVSIGLFTSFLNTDIHEVGCKFTVELFREW